MWHAITHTSPNVVHSSQRIKDFWFFYFLNSFRWNLVSILVWHRAADGEPHLVCVPNMWAQSKDNLLTSMPEQQQQTYACKMNNWVAHQSKSLCRWMHGKHTCDCDCVYNSSGVVKVYLWPHTRCHGTVEKSLEIIWKELFGLKSVNEQTLSVLGHLHLQSVQTADSHQCKQCNESFAHSILI